MEFMGAIRNAGAIFLGAWTPEAVGDYVAGPNHTLPTGGTARYSSPLSVDDFVKKSSIIQYTPQGARPTNDAAPSCRSPRHEGLWAHAESVAQRLGAASTPSGRAWPARRRRAWKVARRAVR